MEEMDLTPISRKVLTLLRPPIRVPNLLSMYQRT